MTDGSAERCCPLCGSADRRRLRQAGGRGGSASCWTLAACRRCAMVYLVERFDYATQAAAFDWQASYDQESQRRSYARPLERGISRRLAAARRRLGGRRGARLVSMALRQRQEGRWCDFGCGAGKLLSQVPSRFERWGVDISAAQAAHAGRIVPDARIIVAPVTEALLEQGSFAVVSMQSYLEHEQHPAAALAAARAILAPGGVAVVKVPNYGSWNRALRGDNWCGYRFPDHLNYFTRRTLAAMLTAAALTPLRGSIFERLPTSDSLYMAAVK